MGTVSIHVPSSLIWFLHIFVISSVLQPWWIFRPSSSAFCEAPKPLPSQRFVSFLQSSGQVINPSPQIRFLPEINCRNLLMLGKLRPAPNEKLKLLGKSRPSWLQIANAMDVLQNIESPPSLSVDFFEDLTHEAEHPSFFLVLVLHQPQDSCK